MEQKSEGHHEQFVAAGGAMRLLGALGTVAGLSAWYAVASGWPGLQVDEVRDIMIGSLVVLSVGQLMCDLSNADEPANR